MQLALLDIEHAIPEVIAQGRSSRRNGRPHSNTAHGRKVRPR
jgi:hypothetical protein